MKQRINTSIFWALAASLLVTCQTSMAKKKAEPLSPAGEKLLAEYKATLETLKKEIVAAAPAIDEATKTSFVNAHGEIAKLPKLPNPNNLKMAPVTFAPGNPAYADAQAKALLEARKVLKEADSFLKGDDMHAKLAKCALLTVGAEEMAAFASQGAKEKSYVDLLLNDDKLIVDVMELGGAYENKFGQAIRNYKAIQKASKNATEKESSASGHLPAHSSTRTATTFPKAKPPPKPSPNFT